MDVKEFARMAREKIWEYLPEEYQDKEILILENQKLNGVRRTGLTLSQPDREFSPVIYLEEFCEEAEGGMDETVLFQKIANLMAYTAEAKPSIEELTAPYEQIKDKLTVQLINTQQNKDLLGKLPHREMGDFSLICAVHVEIGESGADDGFMKVTDAWRCRWGVSEEELFQAAMQSAQKNDPYILNDLLHWMDDGYTGEISCGVLTNESRRLGAAVLLYPGVTDKLSEVFPQGYYLAPASIHEWMVVAKDYIQPAELGRMVREVNREEVPREERLSDRVYEFDREKGRIVTVPESLEAERREQEPCR